MCTEPPGGTGSTRRRSISSRQAVATPAAPERVLRVVVTLMRREPLFRDHATRFTGESRSHDRSTEYPEFRRRSRARYSAILDRYRAVLLWETRLSFVLIRIRLLVVGVCLAMRIFAWLALRAGAGQPGPSPRLPAGEVRARLPLCHHWPSWQPRSWRKTSR